MYRKTSIYTIDQLGHAIMARRVGDVGGVVVNLPETVIFSRCTYVIDDKTRLDAIGRCWQYVYSGAAV
jgi:hypothetical protein